MRPPIQKQASGTTESRNWTICQNSDMDWLKAEVYFLGCHGLILERIPGLDRSASTGAVTLRVIALRRRWLLCLTEIQGDLTYVDASHNDPK